MDLKNIASPIVEGRPAIPKGEFQQPTFVPTGFSELSFQPQPVFRLADLTARTAVGEIASFERILADLAGFAPAPASIGIRFGSSVHCIPRISASRILDQNFLPEMIHDRIIIVGERLPEHVGTYTAASMQKPMSRLELRGHTVLNVAQFAEKLAHLARKTL